MGSVGNTRASGTQSVKEYVLSQLGISESFADEREGIWKELRELMDEREKISKRYLELSDALDKERIINEEDVKNLGRQLAEIFAKLTPQGEEIRKELRTLRDRQKEIDDRLETLNRRTNELDEIVRQTETMEWTGRAPRAPQREITEKDIDRDYKIGLTKGFSGTTATGDIQDALKNYDAYIVYMSPKEYLQRVSHDIFNASLERGVRGVSWENVKKYADEMKAGTRYYMPWLDYSRHKGQEGRHRALAAILNGYDRIPVAIKIR